MENELALQPERKLAAPSTAPSIGALLQAVAGQQITGDTVSVMKELLSMQRDQETNEARKAFARDFVKLQSTIGRIFATKKADRYSYAPFEEIMTTARPTLEDCGFAIRFDSKRSPCGNILTAFCTLMHRDGHTETNEFAVRIGTSATKLSDPQIDGVAGTYARRYALCHALNIVVETDTDGRNQGAKITRQQVAELRALMQEVGSEEAKMLAVVLPKVAEEDRRLEDLSEQAYELLRTMLAMKRKNKPAATETHPTDQTWTA